MKNFMKYDSSEINQIEHLPDTSDGFRKISIIQQIVPFHFPNMKSRIISDAMHVYIFYYSPKMIIIKILLGRKCTIITIVPIDLVKCFFKAKVSGNLIILRDRRNCKICKSIKRRIRKNMIQENNHTRDKL